MLSEDAGNYEARKAILMNRFSVYSDLDRFSVNGDNTIVSHNIA